MGKRSSCNFRTAVMYEPCITYQTTRGTMPCPSTLTEYYYVQIFSYLCDYRKYHQNFTHNNRIFFSNKEQVLGKKTDESEVNILD